MMKKQRTSYSPAEREKLHRYWQWKRKQYLYKKYLMEKKKQRRRDFFKGIAINFLLSIVIFSILLALTSIFFVTVQKVHGADMIPELEIGQPVFLIRREQLKRYMVVAYKPPSSKEVRVGRVIGLPNDTVAYKNDVLSINNQERSENFISTQVENYHMTGVIYTPDFSIKSLTGNATIPEKNYLILGDNRPFATDSRYYGLIERQWILGVVK